MHDRFWSKVNKFGCWIWTADTRNGYGIFWLNNTMKKSHRISLELIGIKLSDSDEVDHRCHQHDCIRPSHLRIVTRKQNMENRSGLNSNNRSGVRGVHWEKWSGKWRASVKHNGMDYRVGRFDFIEDAELAVINKRNELFTHNDLDRL